MINILDKIQGWVQSGPMGNDKQMPHGGPHYAHAGASGQAAGRAAANQPSLQANYNNFLLPESIWNQFKPHFRMQPTEGNIGTQAEFEEKYYSGSINPLGGKDSGVGGDTRYYFDFDFDSDLATGTRHRGSGGTAMGADRYKSGYMFYDKEDAWQAYQDTMEKQYDTGTGQFSGAGAYADINPGDILNRRSLLDAFTSAKGGETRPEEVVPRIKASDLRGLHSGSYTPQVERAKKPLIDRLLANIRTTQGQGSGFAGYGGREASEGSLIADYEGDVQSIYDTIVGEGQMRTIENLVSLMDTYDLATDDIG